MFRLPNIQNLNQTISALWLFAILNVLFRDVHELTMASTINEILAGYVNGNPNSENVLLAAAFAVELLLLAYLLSRLLPPVWVRRVNLVLAPLAVAGTIFGNPSDPDDYFFSAVGILTYVAIFGLCLAWRPHDVQSDMSVTSLSLQPSAR